MAAKFFVILACLALSHAAVVKREAPASTPLQDIERHAAEFQKMFTDQLNALVNSKNAQEWQKALKDGTETVGAQVTALSTSLQGAIGDASGKTKEALEAARTNLEKTAEELRKSHPEVQAQADSLKEKLQAAVENTVKETQKLIKEVSTNAEQANEKLAPTLKKAYDDFVKQAETVQKQLHDAATKQ